jgi:predicted nucleotidyltransferase
VKEIERVARRLSGDPRVDAVYLFGSQASGEADDRSDVDLAVLLREGISLAEELRLRAVAVDELHRDDIDFVILNDAPPLLRYEVVMGGRRLFARDDESADEFEYRAVLRYLDTEYLRRMQHELRREALR